MGLDGVEIVIAWEEAFGISIADADAATLRTPRMAIDLICRKLTIREGEDFCFSQRIFYLLRRSFVTVLACPRAAVTPRTHLGGLIPIRGRQRVWTALSREACLPLPTTMLGIGSWSPTVGDLVTRLTALSASAQRGGSDGGWSRRQVREVVRAVVASQTGIKTFSDDADFIHDLRID